MVRRIGADGSGEDGAEGGTGRLDVGQAGPALGGKAGGELRGVTRVRGRQVSGASIADCQLPIADLRVCCSPVRLLYCSILSATSRATIPSMIGSASADSILQRMIGGRSAHLTPEVARFFLELSFPEPDRKRMAILSEKANEGELSPDEHDELSMYVVLNDFLAIMQSRARMSLKKQSPAA